ncbi:MAG: thiol-disulfide oxidoreductase DCC family protein [Gemmataceae bacterium]
METLTLFYDGLCPLCSREIDHYRRAAAGDPSVAFVDIAGPGFDAASFGLDPARVHREMHVTEGEAVHVGVDAFLAIWRRIPGHRWLLSLARLPLADLFLRAGYFFFATVRPWLPRKQACDAGTCSR